MASLNKLPCFTLLLTLFSFSLDARRLADTTHPMIFQYHKGTLLSGKITTNLIWYGHFSPAQRAIISDFIISISSSKSKIQPSVKTWWSTIDKCHRLANPKAKTSLAISLGNQVIDESYTLGKSLTSKHLVELASKGSQDINTINIVLTASDVTVDGFCKNRCGSHGSTYIFKKSPQKSAYIWVGNSETQCPGQCARPFYKSIYGPQLVAPNNDVGLDGMVINLASLLAGTVTNPYGNGYYQGLKVAPLGVATACLGIYANEADSGYTVRGFETP